MQYYDEMIGADSW